MNYLYSVSRLGSILAFALLLTACASTQISDGWKDQSYSGPVLKQIMVIAIVKDTVEKRIFEDEFTGQLQNAGINAVSSYKYLSGNTMKAPKEEIVKAIEKTGADGVVVVKLKTIDKKDQYVPPNIDWVPGASYYGYYGYYGTSWDAIYTPSVNVTDKYVTLQSRLFAVEGAKLIWAADTVTKNPEQIRKSVRAVGSKVAGKLKSSGFVK